MIEAKLGSGAPLAAAPPTPQGKVRDLMEALRESIAAAKADAPAAAEEGAAAVSKKRARKAG